MPPAPRIRRSGSWRNLDRRRAAWNPWSARQVGLEGHQCRRAQPGQFVGLLEAQGGVEDLGHPAVGGVLDLAVAACPDRRRRVPASRTSGCTARRRATCAPRRVMPELASRLKCTSARSSRSTNITWMPGSSAANGMFRQPANIGIAHRGCGGDDLRPVRQCGPRLRHLPGTCHRTRQPGPSRPGAAPAAPRTATPSSHIAVTKVGSKMAKIEATVTPVASPSTPSRPAT